MHRITLTIIGSILISTSLAGVWFAKERRMEQKLEGPEAPTVTAWHPKTADESTPPPTVLNLELPFFSQAPHGNWDYPWQEACEEASVALIENAYHARYFNADTFNEELLKLVNYEMETFGAYEHTNMEQTAQMLSEMYGLKTIAHNDPSFEDIQNILNQGHFIIWPANGKTLFNPNFKNGGPKYHVLVVKGYDQSQKTIVTNDVGTRRGADYVYSWEVLKNALHEYHDTDMNLGAQTILEVLPPQP